MSTVVLLVEDEPAHAELARRGLVDPRTGGDLEVAIVETLAGARRWIAARTPDLVLADLRLPDGEATDLLADGAPLVVMTSQGDEQRAVAAIKGGALDYVVKSAETFRELPAIVERALRAARAERDRARAEASLRESEARFRQLADNLEQAFWLEDTATGALVYASPAWDRLFGGRAALDPRASARFDLIDPDDQARVRASFEADAATRPTQQEYRVLGGRRIDERTFPVRDERGRAYRIAGIAADVTERRELELALRQSQKMEAIGQLAGGVAHDFNNMLVAIMAAAEQLAVATDFAEVRELGELVLAAGERAASLTRKLLAFSRKGKLADAPVDLHALVRETAGLLQRSIDPRVAIRTALDAATATVVGDAGELQHALLNIALNARDAMPDGGELVFATSVRELDDGAASALPFALAPGAYVQVAVRDSGTGIAPEHRERIFEPFFTTKPVGKGTGLGLAAVYGTVVEHGGAVQVDSEVGRGTELRLLFPLARHARPRSRSPSRAPRGSGLVLLVDDDEFMRTLGARLLARLGYEVITASDGVAGVAQFRDVHARLQAVVCDLIMPAMSGRDACRAMRAIDPAVPIVLCSGYPGDERDAELAPHAYLTKPFRLDELAAVLVHAIAARPQP